MEFKDSKHSKCVNNMVVAFQIFRDINIACWLRKLTRNSYGYRMIYLSLPWVLQFINFLNMIRCNVLYSKDVPVFSYGRDVSNSVVLTGLLFISYYLSGYYTGKADEILNRDDGLYIKRHYISRVDELSFPLKTQKWWKAFWSVSLAGISIWLSNIFFGMARMNGENAYWIAHLDQIGTFWYHIVLIFTWYISLCFLATVIITSLCIYLILADEALIIPKAHPNQSFGILRVTSILVNSSSYGIFYIGGAAVFIINDKLTYKQFGINNMFNKDLPSLIVFAVIMLFVILQFVPLQLMYEKLKNIKNSRLIAIDKALEEKYAKREQCFDDEKGCYSIEKVYNDVEPLKIIRKELLEERTLYFSFSNKIMVTASVVIPLIGVILQLAQLIKMK